MTDQQTERTSQNEEFEGIRATFRDEWNRRTWYGKLWFPVWAIFRLMVILSLILLVLVLAPNEILDPVLSRLGRLVKRPISGVRSLTPEVYDDRE